VLTIQFHNDGTGYRLTPNTPMVFGNYDVTVLINEDVIWKGQIKDHHRREGWQQLVAELVHQLTSKDD